MNTIISTNTETLLKYNLGQDISWKEEALVAIEVLSHYLLIDVNPPLDLIIDAMGTLSCVTREHDEFHTLYEIVKQLDVNSERRNNFYTLSLIFQNYCGVMKNSLNSGNKNKSGEAKSEKDYQVEIIESWTRLSHIGKYRFVKNEVVVHNGVIDILAHCDITDRPVIIELKLGRNGRSAERQLIRYSRSFLNPILIIISEKEIFCKNKLITCLTFHDVL